MALEIITQGLAKVTDVSEQEFSTLDAFRNSVTQTITPDETATKGATARNGSLTKPPGALGRLEDLAIWYAGWRGVARPELMSPQVIIFAGNHGVTAQGVSAFPAEVTVQMVANFRAGGAAINQLARLAGAQLDVVELDLDHPTADFTQSAAMDDAELLAALNAGWAAVNPKCDCLILGEMGIGNTTSAAAIGAAIFGGAPSDWVGRGTGVDDEGLKRKAGALSAGLALHKGVLHDPLAVLGALGGREIAAITGAIAHARAAHIPVILDGFIASSAASVLWALNPQATDICVAGHLSAEGGHDALLNGMGLKPLLSLGLRLGEGSGAAVAFHILKSALACHGGMATFEEAAVSGKS